MPSARDRSRAFCERFGIRVPILLAPMAGASAPSLSIAVASAGGLGACGALLMTGTEILKWCSTVRASSNGAFQLNLWIPGPPPRRDASSEAHVRAFLGAWGPPVPADAGDAVPLDFSAQCDALLDAAPPVVSSVRDSIHLRSSHDSKPPTLRGLRPPRPSTRRGAPRPPVRTSSPQEELRTAAVWPRRLARSPRRTPW